MSNISGQLIKDTFNYVLQSDLITGIVYRIGGTVPLNPKFISGLTVNANFTYSDGSEFPGYVLTCDALGNAVWAPVSGATSGVVITGGTFDYSVGTLQLRNSNGTSVTITGLTDTYVTGGTVSGTSIIFSYNDTNTFQVTGITPYNLFSSYTASTQVTINNKLDVSGFTAYTATTQPLILNAVTGGTYSGGTLFLINNSGNTIPITGFTTGGTSGLSGEYLPLSGGTVTGNTIFTSGLTATTISATTYLNLPIDVFVTGGTYLNGTLFLTNNTGNTFTVTGFNTATGNTTNFYGSFSDTTTQTVIAADTPTAWSANTTEISNGIQIIDGSKITVYNDGIYEIGYSAQIELEQGTGDEITIWAKINGNDVDRSSSTISLQNSNSYSLPFVSYIFELYAGDYVEFYFSSPSEHARITTLSGLTSPTRPVSPSLILVAKAIGNAVLNTSGDSFVTAFTLSNDVLSLKQNRVGLYSGFTVSLPYLNSSGGTITGNLNVLGNVTSTTYFGDGSNLTGISRGGGGGAGGQLYYFNISNTQSPYFEFSTSATTNSEQTITVTTGSTQTAFIGGFMTPFNLPNITDFPAGILSFYLHCDTNAASATFNLYCEVYKRTTGNTETLLMTTDSVSVAGTSTLMYITDGYFSGATLNKSDRLVVKLFATNTSNQTRSLTFRSEGSQYYSFALTTIPTFSDSFVTGFTLNNDIISLNQNRTDQFSALSVNLSGYVNNNTFSSYTASTEPLIGSSVTGVTYNDANTFTFTNNTGGTFDVSFNTVTGLTANTISATTYQNLPVSAVTSGSGISAVTSNGVVTVTNLSPDQTVTITGGTNIQIEGSYPNFGVNFTGTTGGGGSFTGGTVSGATNFTGGLSANTISATTISGDTLFGNGANLTGIPRTGQITSIFDGLGGVIQTGIGRNYITIPYTGTLTGWTIFSSVVGTIDIDFYDDNYANFPPTSADTIFTSINRPKLTNTNKNQATGLNIPLTSGDILIPEVLSVTGCTNVVVNLQIIRTT